ncbi:MAG TPA: hypothetical protein VFO77_01450 [Actinoplanes sp.]|nr:hypothetical protein [Actinoplanes sp.]
MSNPLPPGATGTDQTFAPALLGTFREGVSLLEHAIQQIKDAVNCVINAVTGFIQRVNAYLDDRHFWQKPFDWLFDDLQVGCEKLQAVIFQIQEKVNSVLDTVEKSVNGSFPVFSLFDVGMDWATKVKTPLSDISPDLTPSGKIDSWRGPAHETFVIRVRDQADAIDAVVGKVTATSTWLSGVAEANVHFVSDLTVQVSEVVRTLTALGTDVAQVAATDVAGALQASNHASEVIGEAVAMILNFVAILASRLAEVVAKINELANEYGDHTGLPRGQWPQAVNA